MDLKLQKRLASEVMRVGTDRVHLDPEREDDIKQAITRQDIRGLIRDGAISKKPKKGSSKARIRKAIVQKRKGRGKGAGHRRGTGNARKPTKQVWMSRVRAQRKLLKGLKEKKVLKTSDYRKLYLKVKGGFFRSVAHLKLHIKKGDI